MYRFITIAFIAVFSFVSISANQTNIDTSSNFEGTVTYDVDYTGQSVAAFKSMLPNSYRYSFLNGDFAFQLEGGMAAAMVGDVVYKSKEDQAYMIMHAEKKAYTFDKPADESDSSEPVIEDLNEQETIAGYICNKYMVTIKSGTETSVQYVWATKELTLKTVKGKSLGSAGSLFASGVNGFPLKVKLTKNAMGMSIGIEMTANKVDLSKPSAELFVIPADYAVEKLDPKKMGF